MQPILKISDMMKIFLTSVCVFMFSWASAQISTAKMNDLHVGMTVKQVEQLTKIKVSDLSKEYAVTVKGIPYKIMFGSTFKGGQYTTDVLSYIETRSVGIKTLSGIGMGSSLDELWKNYQKYNFTLYKNNKEGLRSFFIIDEENATNLEFELKAGKVQLIRIFTYNPEECTL